MQGFLLGTLADMLIKCNIHIGEHIKSIHTTSSTAKVFPGQSMQKILVCQRQSLIQRD